MNHAAKLLLPSLLLPCLLSVGRAQAQPVEAPIPVAQEGANVGSAQLVVLMLTEYHRELADQGRRLTALEAVVRAHVADEVQALEVQRRALEKLQGRVDEEDQKLDAEAFERARQVRLLAERASRLEGLAATLGTTDDKQKAALEAQQAELKALLKRLDDAVADKNKSATVDVVQSILSFLGKVAEAVGNGFAASKK
jgi:septal ring factor EnvC (AmiA/AmiB activator)